MSTNATYVIREAYYGQYKVMGIEAQRVMY